MESVFKAISDAGVSVSKGEPFERFFVEIDGFHTERYIVSDQDVTGGDSLVLPNESRAILSYGPYLNAEGFWKENLLGGSVEYDVDLSQIECGCIASLYMVLLPAKSKDGWYVKGGDGYYYCDSNGNGGSFCPEFDIMEAN